MRIWSLHPRYLDPQGLVALWRETLLAQKVLKGETRGYRHHPQLRRFQAEADPLGQVNRYLAVVCDEATARGYSFNRDKIGALAEGPIPIAVTDGQMAYEWEHLRAKLAKRSPAWGEQWLTLSRPEAHPLFRVVSGAVEDWEKT